MPARAHQPGDHPGGVVACAAVPSSTFLDRSRRGIGKSQSIWADATMETAGSPNIEAEDATQTMMRKPRVVIATTPGATSLSVERGVFVSQVSRALGSRGFSVTAPVLITTMMICLRNLVET
eukprot:COSAG01_NODE_21991_length_876_cov_13.550837_2_plen_122_part_00